VCNTIHIPSIKQTSLILLRHAIVKATIKLVIPNERRATLHGLFWSRRSASIFTRLQIGIRIGEQYFHHLMTTLNLTGFSRAAMRAGHRLAPKMDASAVEHLLLETGLAAQPARTCLQGMLVSQDAVIRKKLR